jgi:hypothetical protein
MARNGKRKQSTNESTEVKSESRSSRRKTADTKVSAKKNTIRQKSNEANTSSSQNMSLKEEQADDTGKLDQSISSMEKATPMSLSDRIEQLLPKELELNEESDMSEEDSVASDPIPVTIERPPLDWLHEPSEDGSSEDEDSMNWEAVEDAETVEETEAETEPSLNISTPQQVFKDVEITFEAPKSQIRYAQIAWLGHERDVTWY